MVVIVVAVVAVAASVLPGRSQGAPPTARVAACDSLGAADDFAVFSDGVLTATGTSFIGRIAAAGDISLDAIQVDPGAGDASPTVITGADLSAGFTGAGGTINGGARYAGTLNQAANFVINGGTTKGAPPFSFADEFRELRLLSDTWAAAAETPGATVTLQPWGALEFVGPSTGLNVFTVDAADFVASQIQGVVVTLPSASASALINVTTNTDLTIAPQYLNPEEIASPLIWNFPLATSLTISTSPGWKGLILAPNARIDGAGRPQLVGQLIAGSVPQGAWTITGTPLAECPPGPEEPPPPDTSLSLEALCVDPFDNLAMRLRNTGERDRNVVWNDLGGPDFGAFVAHAERDRFFNVRDSGPDSVIRVTADGGTTITAPGTTERCEGEITVTKRVSGGLAPPGPWTIEVAGADGQAIRTAELAAGQSATFDALGGYQPGSAQFGQVVGGIVYAIRETDTLGGTATISHNPVEILTEQHESVTVTNHFPEVEPPDPENPDPPPIDPPIDPEQPTLPPGVPEPPSGPDLGGVLPGYAAADLEVRHTSARPRAPVGGTFNITTRVPNRGNAPAVDAVLRELPQLRRSVERGVADILSIKTSRGACRRTRPVRCTLGRLRPGEQVVVRTRARVNLAATLRSVVYVSSRSPESNTTNNIDVEPLTVTPPTNLRVAIKAPPFGRVGLRFAYRVSVTGTGRAGADQVRLCAPRPDDVTGVRAAGTFGYRGARCRNIPRLPAGRTVSFDVTAVPAASGSLRLTALATAVGRAGAARDRTRVQVAGDACAAAVARAAC